MSRSQWPCCLRRRSADAHLLRSWVRIPPGGMSVCCECCVLLGRGFCDELITRPEKSYRLWCVNVCDRETPRMRRPWPALGRYATRKKERKKERKKNACLTTYRFNFVFQSNYCRIWPTHHPRYNQQPKTVRTSKDSNEVTDILDIIHRLRL